MAPFRAGGRSNRSGRSQADHDVFEGLPVRQWHQSETLVGLSAPTETVADGDNAWPELPMPRDSAQLAPWTQQLLREARRPRLAKRPQEPTEDDKQEEEEEGETLQTGWLSKKWSQVPSHLEKPEREFLAKRRKGLPSLHTQIALQAANAAAASAPTRRTKVMKSDAEGNTTVYEVLVPEGQVVEGEVVDDTVMADAAPVQAAPGTVIEGVGIANAEGIIVATDLLQQQQPARRKPIPPRRIRKGGPGRGKKKVMFNPEHGHNAAATSTAADGISTTTPSTLHANADDSAMDIDSTPKPDANDEGDDDDGDDGEEGEEDDDREDGEVSEEDENQASELEHSSRPDAAVPVDMDVEAEEPVAAATETVAEEPAPAVEEAQERAPAVEETQEPAAVPEAAEDSNTVVEEAEVQPAAPPEEVEKPTDSEEAIEVGDATVEPELPTTRSSEEEQPKAPEPQMEPTDKETNIDTTAGSEKLEEQSPEKDMTMKEATNEETEES